MDLSDVAVVDNHCHAVQKTPGRWDVAGWRALFSESPDHQMRTETVADTVFYQRLIGEMARHYGVAPDEESVLAARAAQDDAELTERLFVDAGIGALVVDTGYPDASVSLPLEQMGAGRQVAVLLRLELLFQDLVASAERYDGLLDAVREQLLDVRRAGWAGFKSIAGYRTGLAIRRWSRDEALQSFDDARREVSATGSVRLGHKPLLDTLLHVAFEAAAAQELPVQFHVGYGDPDADLRDAHPLLLRELFEEPAYRAIPIVLLHGCWPFFREGAYLAAVYANAHLDLSYAIPFLSRPEMRSMTAAALGAAPTSKLMYSSDGARVPELHWLGALDGRRVLGEALGDLMDDGDLTPAQARRAGEQVLRDNARTLYGLGGAA